MPSDGTAPRILVVEDESLTREFTVEMITSFGYRVVEAGDALTAMRVIADTPSIELVFTDVSMPGLDGIMLADMVKQHRPRLKILYTTGGAGLNRLKTDAGILHGDVLQKPYLPSQLEAEIRRLLN